MEIAPAMLDGEAAAVPSPSSSSTFTSQETVNKNSSSRYDDDDDDDDEEEDVCRICRNPGDADNPLRYPCACSGSIKFVHQDCLLQWLNHSNARQCEVLDKTPEAIVNPVLGESSSHTYVKGSYNLSGAGIPIEKWNGDGDFCKWQWTMKAVLRRNHVHTVVYAQDQLDPSVSALELFEMKEWAFTTLQMAMGENVIPEVYSETTAEGIWNRLEELYLKKSLKNKWALTKLCLSFNMKEGTTIKKHLIAFQDLIMKMKAFDAPPVHDEEALAIILLSSLPDRYTQLTNSLIYGGDAITLSDVKERILSEDLRTQMWVGNSSHKNVNNSQDLFVESGCRDERQGNRGRNRGHLHSQKPGYRGKSRHLGN